MTDERCLTDEWWCQRPTDVQRRVIIALRQALSPGRITDEIALYVLELLPWANSHQNGWAKAAELVASALCPVYLGLQPETQRALCSEAIRLLKVADRESGDT